MEYFLYYYFRIDRGTLRRYVRAQSNMAVQYTFYVVEATPMAIERTRSLSSMLSTDEHSFYRIECSLAYIEDVLKS